MTNQNSTLSFRVSAGLKNIIGRDLISDKYIAETKTPGNTGFFSQNAGIV